MSLRQGVTRVLPAADVPGKWDELLDEVISHDACVLVEREGAPAAALISAQELARLRALDARATADKARIEAFAEVYKHESPEDMEREVTRALAEVRTERRAATHARAMR